MELSKDTVQDPELPTSHLNNKEFLKEYAAKQPEKYEKFYNYKVAELYKSINILSTFTFTTTTDTLVALCEARLSSLDINAVRFQQDKKLSKNGRIKLPKIADIFEGITIACVKPSDIDSVTLFSAISVPKDADDEKFKNYFPHKDARPHIKHYVPIKTIKNPESSFVTFFDNPILLLCEVFTNLSIQVVFKKELNLKQDDPYSIFGRHVKMNYVFLDLDIKTIAHTTYLHETC
jgi:hypothetical protein